MDWTEEQNKVINWLINYHDAHPTESIFEVYSLLWTNGNEIASVPVNVWAAFNSLTTKEQNQVGGYASLPF